MLAIKEANQEFKYDQKIYADVHQNGHQNVTVEIEGLVQALMKVRANNEGTLPKVRKMEEHQGLVSQLSTIVEKESEENLLHNYIKYIHMGNPIYALKG